MPCLYARFVAKKWRERWWKWQLCWATPQNGACRAAMVRDVGRRGHFYEQNRYVAAMGLDGRRRRHFVLFLLPSR
ncbi:protein of unknown function (plasmid) [Cupriavidus neocaledonicus]|uniref:Uncharacterized protein n=1 Tax=Cupriavidus neocaledonicus TaxID=1040979 RepID=A0A375HPZ7_9BURK|nr:hypothetical protein CBM2605_B150020 [Cupriavidus neocaledonicus]SPD59086.1 protein of unknown function [Cupriavidus neocaledonicus]